MDVGEMNRNGQILLEKTNVRSTTHSYAKIWVMRCTQCENVYGSNGCDAHERKCPKCNKNVPPGEPI
jgi:NAD-dependent SIR2 family protein deacetylase